MDLELLKLFSDEIVRKLLVELVQKRKASFREIQELVPTESPEALAADLDRLKTKELVGVVKSQYSDFDTYYLTAEGLKSFRAFTNAFAVGK